MEGVHFGGGPEAVLARAVGILGLESECTIPDSYNSFWDSSLVETMGLGRENLINTAFAKEFFDWIKEL